MSQTNGHTNGTIKGDGPPNGMLTNGVPESHPAAGQKETMTPEQMRSSTKQMRIANAYYRTLFESRAIQSSLLEAFSWYGGNQGFGFGGTDMTEIFLRLQDQTSGGLAPAQPNDRRGGRKWPIWQNDTQRNRVLQAARILCATNDYAKALLRNNTNYTIGKGFSYKCQIKDDKPFMPVYGEDDAKAEERRQDLIVFKQGAQKVVDAVQKWLDDFCARNNWNTSATANDVNEDGTVNAAGSTQEREACWRVDRDGEAMIRLHGQSDGTVITRFIGPEVVWGAPPGGTEDNGWSFGMQHLVVEEETETGQINKHFDLTRIKSYYVRFHAAGMEVEGKNNTGVEVPASEVVHIKDPWEDAEVKRGTSAFAYDCFDALIRAANLQRNISITSSVQAATAEVWVHKIGTKQSIQEMAAGLPGAQAGSNNLGAPAGAIQQRIYPGQIRRVPAGQEPVPDPATTQVQSYMQAAQGDTRQAASGMCAPEYLASADASNNNYASIKEAGTPYVRASESRQEHFKTAFLRVMWRVIRYAVKLGKLPHEALTLVKIQVEGMEIVKNNEQELAQARTNNLQAKVTSPQIEIAKLGNDVAQVMADWHEWDAKMQPQQPGGMPGAVPGAPAPGGAPAGAEQTPGAQPPGNENDPLAGVPTADLSQEFAQQQKKPVDQKRSMAAKLGWQKKGHVVEKGNAMESREARLNWIPIPALLMESLRDTEPIVKQKMPVVEKPTMEDRLNRYRQMVEAVL